MTDCSDLPDLGLLEAGSFDFVEPEVFFLIDLCSFTIFRLFILKKPVEQIEQVMYVD